MVNIERTRCLLLPTCKWCRYGKKERFLSMRRGKEFLAVIIFGRTFKRVFLLPFFYEICEGKN